LLRHAFGGAHKIMHQCGYFYIMTNIHNTVLYCGATTNLYDRVLEHRYMMFQKSFTSRYNINNLVYFEAYTFARDAFQREKQMKAGSRKKKVDLIESVNPQWEDLFAKVVDGEVEELRRIKNHYR
jgi:putative endonuclease